MTGSVEGTVRIGFIVERDGTVSAAQVLSHTLQPAASSGDAATGYADAIAEAMGGWRFRPPLMRCRGQIEMTVAYSQVAH